MKKKKAAQSGKSTSKGASKKAAKSTSRGKWTGARTGASARRDEPFFDMLREDHRQVRQMLDKVMERGEDARTVFNQVVEALELHAEAEESLLYPTLEDFADTSDLAFEATEEHAVVDTLLNDLDTTDEMDARWFARARVLQKAVETHIDEEENELFPRAAKLLHSQQAALARQYAEIKASELEASRQAGEYRGEEGLA